MSCFYSTDGSYSCSDVEHFGTTCPVNYFSVNDNACCPNNTEFDGSNKCLSKTCPS